MTEKQTCGNCDCHYYCPRTHGRPPSEWHDLTCLYVPSRWFPVTKAEPAPVKPVFDERIAIDEKVMAILDCIVDTDGDPLGSILRFKDRVRQWERAMEYTLLSPAARELIEAAMELDDTVESNETNADAVIHASQRLHAALAPFMAKEPPKKDPTDYGYCHCPACGWEGRQTCPTGDDFPCRCGEGMLVNGRRPTKEPK